MAKSLNDMLIARPVDRAAVDAHKCRMLEEVRAYQLKELRKKSALTQAQVADRLGDDRFRLA